MTYILAFTPSTVPSSSLKTALKQLRTPCSVPLTSTLKICCQSSLKAESQFLPSSEGPFPFFTVSGNLADCSVGKPAFNLPNGFSRVTCKPLFLQLCRIQICLVQVQPLYQLQVGVNVPNFFSALMVSLAPLALPSP